jgi:hypothetical protein
MEGLRSAARDRAAAPMAAQTATPAKTVIIVPARLDGSNFRSLTGGTDIAELASATIFGPTVAGLRSAARVETATLLNVPARYSTRFSHMAAALPADHFGSMTPSQESALALVDNKSGE